MKKYLITGIGGFVGRYFWEYLLEHEPEAQVLGIDMTWEKPWTHPSFRYSRLNLMDAPALRGLVAEFQPDHIVHLASISSVGQSWKAPADCFTNNTTIFLNLVEAVRAECPSARLLSVGSSEEYGNYPPEAMPLREEYELRPCSPYAVARVAQEMLSKLYAESYGLNIMMTRSFNHIGPRQKDVFVVPSFVKQLVEIKKNGGSGVMRVGNIDIVRDFLDVRDVVDAYYRIITRGAPGEVYNVCSGKGIRLDEIIFTTADILGIKPNIEVDPALMRPADNTVIIGDCCHLQSYLGWKRIFSFDQTLHDMIRHFEELRAC